MDQIKLFKKGQKKFDLVLTKTITENELPPKPYEITPVDFTPYIQNAIAEMDEFNMYLIQKMRKLEREVMIECGHAQSDDEKQPTKRLPAKKGKKLVQRSEDEDNQTEIVNVKRDI